MAKKPVKNVGYDEMLACARERATPIDIDGLISAGAIRKSGAWYEVLDMSKMSDQGRRGFIAAKQTTTKKANGKKELGPLLVKFRKPSAKLAKFLKKL